MAGNNQPLLLLYTNDDTSAWESFQKFVKGAFGDDVNISNVRSLFKVWQDARNGGEGDGICFTRKMLITAEKVEGNKRVAIAEVDVATGGPIQNFQDIFKKTRN